jgi:hypothetical protein
MNNGYDGSMMNVLEVFHSFNRPLSDMLYTLGPPNDRQLAKLLQPPARFCARRLQCYPVHRRDRWLAIGTVSKRPVWPPLVRLSYPVKMAHTD